MSWLSKLKFIHSNTITINVFLQNTLNIVNDNFFNAENLRKLFKNKI
ncbi:hypothetical protein SAMN05421682_10572 [Chryseobacterium indoltheticum]|uniref:Uncharacterized protein n=1 Tax=Chryseobacterium indoltheticum TaxID=254 RepID=A0A381JQM7_9FLAO|nr:hypothetical protein SAMN05421682_10572 [Chryseobacterium indoltheticum]SUY53753.1 Uncharacterised protein [Chryseobacterium indoltheticum]